MSMASRPQGEGPAHWTDEDLVALEQQEGDGRGWTELERRYAAWRDALVALVAQVWRLSAADLADARQEAALASQEAIRRFDRARGEPAEGGRFRAFLQQVVTGRVLNYCRD